MTPLRRSRDDHRREGAGRKGTVGAARRRVGVARGAAPPVRLVAGLQSRSPGSPWSEAGARWEVVRSQAGLLRRPGEEGLIAITAVDPNRRLAWHDVQQRFTATVDLEDDRGQTRARVIVEASGGASRSRGSGLRHRRRSLDCMALCRTARGAALMFDLRYHVASLAAVFVALLIGILVGVGLTGKVDDAEKNELRRQAAAAESQLQSLNEQQANAMRESTCVAQARSARIPAPDGGPAPRSARRAAVHRPGRRERANGSWDSARGCRCARPHPHARAEAAGRPGAVRRRAGRTGASPATRGQTVFANWGGCLRTSS